MKQNTKRLASMIIALLFVVAAFVVYFDLLEPAYGDLESAKGQEVGQAQFLSNEQTVVAQAQKLIASYNDQSQSAQSVSLALPIGKNNAAALAQVYGLAQANSIAVQSIDITAQAPQPSGQAQAAAQAAGNGVAQGAPLVQPIGTLSFQLIASGSYENFATFLQGLETNIRIFDVTALTIHSVAVVTTGKNAAPVSQDFFTYTITVAAYYQVQ